jgi:dTDP-4-dehydrorhamnose 3,5-epimerase
MNLSELDLAGAKLVTPNAFSDARGFFVETYQLSRYADQGIDVAFVQDNHSRSTHGTLRGLHYQSRPGQAKLVSVARGRIFDVMVDIRPQSPTFGKHSAYVLDDERHQQLFVPIGFAHGFCVLSEIADVCYKVSAPYNAATECGIRFDDPQLAIAWPIDQPLVSDRDRSNETFADYCRRIAP